MFLLLISMQGRNGDQRLLNYENNQTSSTMTVNMTHAYTSHTIEFCDNQMFSSF